ncbi:hypothetical protein ABW20_dc0106615 [Dactylellina cionopaga]|nr:hypothetical protein ABW20_dc0106615 [Dactylellina cionopaga]
MVVNDLIHIYGLYIARMEMGLGFGWDLSKKEDWEVFFPTYPPLILRLAFLAGWDGWTGDDGENRSARMSMTEKEDLLRTETRPIPFLCWS